MPTRFSPRCGTNFAALAAPVTFFADRLLPFAPAFWSPVVVLVLSLALTMELWRLVQRSSRGLWHAFLLPGLALQRLTTREPTLARDAGRAAGRGGGAGARARFSTRLSYDPR